MRTSLILAGASAVVAILYLRRKPKPNEDVPATMRAVVVRDSKCVLMRNWPTPSLGENDILIKVKSTAINRLDLLQRTGKAPVPKGVTEVLGLEAAGVVVAVGEKARSFSVGDEVMALVPGGGYAEYVAVHHQTVMRKPSKLSWEAAGSIPEAWLTAFKLVHVVGKLAKGERCVVHAAASGVGVAAIQLVNAAGGSAFVTVGSTEKLKLCLDRLGAVAGAIRQDGPWVEKLKGTEAMRGGAELILDPVASNYAEQNLEALAIDGRWVLYSLLSGPGLTENASKAFLGSLARKRVSLLATTLRARPMHFKAELVSRFSREVLPHMADGEASKFDHIIDKRYSGLAQAQVAQEYMESNANVGKIVLRVSD